MVIQQVRVGDYNIYITGIIPKSQDEGTIIYRRHKNSQVDKITENYCNDPQYKNCITTPTIHIPMYFIAKFLADNGKTDKDGNILLEEVLIDKPEENFNNFG